MSDADPPNDPRVPAHAPGGAIPPGVLDPTIVTFSPPVRWGREKYTASDDTILSRSSVAFQRSFSYRVERPLGGFYRGGEIARFAMYGEIVPDSYIPTGLPPIISDERIEELWLWMGLNQEPGEIQRTHAMDEQVGTVTPQFTLRNVKRAEFETNPHRPPYHMEIWRDPITHERDFPSQMVLTYRRPDFNAIELTFAITTTERTRRDDLLARADWAHEWGDWWTAVERPKIDTTFFPVRYVKRLRGRFANAAEAEAEAEAKKKSRKHDIHFSIANPEGVWTDSFKR